MATIYDRHPLSIRQLFEGQMPDYDGIAVAWGRGIRRIRLNGSGNASFEPDMAAAIQP